MKKMTRAGGTQVKISPNKAIAKPRKEQGPAATLAILERLANSAERLVLAVERIAEGAVQRPREHAQSITPPDFTPPSSEPDDNNA